MDPPLIDQDPARDDEDVAGLEVLTSDALDDEVAADESDRALAAALDDGRVSELVGRGRVINDGVALSKAKDTSEPDLLHYRLFSCETLRSVDVLIERAGLQVVDVVQSEGQPGPTAEELDRAVALAAAELGVDETSGLVGRAIFMTREDPGDPLFRHRLADCRFGKPDSRRPTLRALVDVCEERVISSGAFGRVDL
jgi:hypothetical protein